VVTVFTFGQIAPTPTVEVFASGSALSPIGLTADSSTLSTIDGGLMALTKVYTVTDPSLLPVIGIAEVRIAVGGITEVGGVTNKTQSKATIIACAPSDLLFRACEAAGIGSPVVDVIKPVATLDALIHEKFFTVTYSEPATAGDRW
jgi:hypothetical protein